MAVSVLRGLDLLEAVGMGEVGISELARRTGFDKASVSRTVKALVDAGWLFRDGDKFSLGAKALTLGGATSQRDAVNRANEIVRIVGGITMMSCFATQLYGEQQAIMAAAQGPGMPVIAADGSQYPTYLTVSGLCLLSALEPAAAEAIVDAADLTAFRPGAISGAEDLKQDVARARGGSVVVERGRNDPSYGCAAKVWNVEGMSTPMSLSILGPVTRIDAELELFETLLVAATAPGADRLSIMTAVTSRS
ncbi:hypothetical protein GCM10022234_07310 [Aeromicrobium panaciterrae]|uniref:IclR family transcriptional regulator n=1 Tax=Aeromicrobium panaciterrae TaxID=363861 RepID=UPI0031D19899